MAKARAIVKRLKAVRNIRKITRTMELIATARFKKAMDRATAATAFTSRMTKLVQDLMASGLEVSHPLLEKRETVRNATLLLLTASISWLWNHYAFREWAAAHADEETPRFKFLDETSSWWKEYYQDTDRRRQREYFAGTA